MKEQPKRFTTKKIEDIKPLAPKKSMKGTILFLKISLAFLLLACATYGIWAFFDTYSLQTPVVFQSPLVARHQNAIISPVASPSAKTSAVFDVGAITDKIYTLESSGGKNDSCRNLGLYNGYGYRQNSREWVCYSSHEEVRQLVINWITTHVKDGDIEKALCLYNRGLVESQCTYSINYKSL